MVPASQPSSSQPFPPHLKSDHPNPQTPWNFSEPLFKRVQNYTSDKSFKLCEVLNTDPELNFILKYFEHQKPPGYSIKRVVCIHNPDQSTFFEAGLKNMERESNNPVFAPKGKAKNPKPIDPECCPAGKLKPLSFLPLRSKVSPPEEPTPAPKPKSFLYGMGVQKRFASPFAGRDLPRMESTIILTKMLAKEIPKVPIKGILGPAFILPTVFSMPRYIAQEDIFC